MKKQLIAGALAALAVVNASALTAGDIAFTSFNADEDGFSLVTFVDLAANTKIYFGDNEFVSGAFNTGESYSSWTTGPAVTAAGTVVRFTKTDSTTPGASVGTFARETVSGSTNWGIAASNEVIYAYLGGSASAPTTFLTAITNGSFSTDGSLAGTGLTEGVNAIRLNALVPSATPDYAEYNGPRTGQAAFAGYKTKVFDVANWTVDTTNGAYSTTVPNTTAFTVTAVPEPGTYALMLAGLAAVGGIARRRRS